MGCICICSQRIMIFKAIINDMLNEKTCPTEEKGLIYLQTPGIIVYGIRISLRSFREVKQYSYPLIKMILVTIKFQGIDH